MKCAFSLEAETTKQKVLDYRCLMRRQDSLEKAAMLEKSGMQQEKRKTGYEMD